MSRIKDYTSDLMEYQLNLLTRRNGKGPERGQVAILKRVLRVAGLTMRRFGEIQRAVITTLSRNNRN